MRPASNPPTSPTRTYAGPPFSLLCILTALLVQRASLEPSQLPNVLFHAIVGRRSRQLIGAAPEGGAAAPPARSQGEGSTPADTNDEESSSGKDRALFVVRGRAFGHGHRSISSACN